MQNEITNDSKELNSINQTPMRNQADPLQPDTTSFVDANTLQLLAEEPTIAIERLSVGKVQIRKEIRTKEIQLPITLKQEVLIIDHVASNKLAQPLPDTTLRPQDPTNTSDWDAWVKITQDTPTPTAKILINGRPHELQQPLEVVISQEFAHVQIQTLLAETVRLTTSTQEHAEAIPVQLRHEELVTNRVNYETPQVLYREEIDTTTAPNQVYKATEYQKTGYHK